MLLDKTVRYHVDNPPENHDQNGLFDLRNGFIYLNNELFKKNPKALIVVLFQDAFEVCNPLGSSKGKFKMVGVYMSLFNLPPELRSKIDNIKLVLLCCDKYITSYGWSEVLKHVVQDLSILETTGIEIFLVNKISNYVGTLAAITGDNLGSNSLGGFMESFTGQCCRQCVRSMEEIRENFAIKKSYRTPESYSYDFTESTNTNKQINGVKNDCPFNSLKYFHVCNPGLPPCIARIFLKVSLNMIYIMLFVIS